MSKTKAQLIEELNVLKDDFKKTREFVLEAWADNDAMREELNQAKEEITLLQDRNVQLQNEQNQLSVDYKWQDLCFRELESDLRSELARQKRKYKLLLNAVTPLAAAIIFLTGMIIWLMV